MAWKAKTFAKALMTVALEIPLGIFSGMTDRFGYAKAKHSHTVFSSNFKPALYGQSSQHSDTYRGTRIKHDQFRTPLHTFAGSIPLSGLSFFAFSSKTSVVSG